MNRLSRHIRRLSVPFAILATTLLATGAATASAPTTAGIEGVWSFNAGQIAIQSLSKGAYAGTVVAETKFAECAHPVGQQIWTGITEQSDGSYWGLHQWYQADCQLNPQLGATAWRVIEEAGGARYMRVCFSHPGTLQPTITADGAPKQKSEYAAHDVTYGCYDSALIAPLPTTTPGSGGSGSSGAVESLSLPRANKCLSAKLLKIRLKDPRYDPFKTVRITFKGRKLATSRHGSYVVATINLTHVHANSFVIKVHATTVLGHSLSTHRTYHRCTKKHTKKHKRGKHGK